jgi:hypothetical protein
MCKALIAVSLGVLVFAPSGFGQSQKVSAAAEKATSVTQDAESAAKLPVRRVVLYKNGVGYFEHLGHVRGNQKVLVDFTSAQLNDVLKSLTVLDLTGGRIAGVSYNSEAPLTRRLRELRLPLGEQTTLAQFLSALRGARLEVRSGGTAVSGRLLSIERKTRISGGTTLEVDYLTLITDAGEVRGMEIAPGTSVRIGERDLNQEVGRYLTLVASTRERDLRRMTILTTGSGDRQIYVSYISEVPVWKTTYRVVLPGKSGARPLLQGWAVVDNTVGEDWNDVELSLVAGAPQSFIQQLSQPYYVRRPVVPLPEAAALTPQTHEAALLGGYGQLAGNVTDPQGAAVPGTRIRILNAAGTPLAETSTNNDGHYRFDSIPAGAYRLEVMANGFKKTMVNDLEIRSDADANQNLALQVGNVTTTVNVSASNQSLETTSATLGPGVAGSGRQLGSGRGLGRSEGGGVSSGRGGGAGGGMFMPSVGLSEVRASTEAAAQGRDLGDLFEYKLKERVTIRKNQSALVPILQTELAVEKVSVWNPNSGSVRPLRAVWITNTSPYTLDGGSFSVLEDETFAGEGLLDPIKPGERRLLSYATDLGVLVQSKTESEPQRVTRVRIARGTMVQTSEQRQTRTLTVRNEDTSSRTILLEIPARPGWNLAEGLKPEETTVGFHRFRLTVAPKQTSMLAVTETRPLDARYELTNLNEDQVALFLRQRSINPEIEAALRKVLEQKSRVAALEQESSTREEEMDRIFDDQQRIRENLKALKGSAEERALVQRYTQQLSDQEKRLEQLRSEKVALEKKHAEAQTQLDNLIQQLALEVAL